MSGPMQAKHAEVQAAFDAKQAVLDAATPAPWASTDGWMVRAEYRADGALHRDDVCDTWSTSTDAALIAEMRNDRQAAIDLARLVVEKHWTVSGYLDGYHLPCGAWPCAAYRAAAKFAGVDLDAVGVQAGDARGAS